jgi:hypothetical protein
VTLVWLRWFGPRQKRRYFEITEYPLLGRWQWVDFGVPLSTNLHLTQFNLVFAKSNHPSLLHAGMIYRSPITVDGSKRCGESYCPRAIETRDPRPEHHGMRVRKLHSMFTRGSGKRRQKEAKNRLSALISPPDSRGPSHASTRTSRWLLGGEAGGWPLLPDRRGFFDPFRNVVLYHRSGIAQPAHAGSTPLSCSFARLAVRYRLARNSDGETRKRTQRGEEKRACPKQAASRKLRGRDEHIRRARFWSNRRPL